MSIAPKIYMTIEEAANFTGISKFYIRNGCRRNEIPHIMSGSKYLVNVPRFLELLEAQDSNKSEV